MMVTFVSECEKKALNRTRRVLDAFANRIGSRTWQTVITEEGLQAVKKLLRKTATKNTAVACHWIRSRSRSELVWVVGNRSKFNREGIVPVNITEAEIEQFMDKYQWQTIDVIKYSATIAGLFHDFGKATSLFQKKINPDEKTSNFEPYRHEWISFRLFQAFVGQQTDEEWLVSLSDVGRNDFANCFRDGLDKEKKPKLSDLPAFAKLVAWLIVTHHKLPVYPGWKENDQPDLKCVDQWIDEHFTALWNSHNCKDADQQGRIEENWRFCDLPTQSMQWRSKACSLASEALADLRPWFSSKTDWLHEQLFTTHLSRLCLVLSDHYYSSLSFKELQEMKVEKWRNPNYRVYANTEWIDGKKNYKQQLDEHLIAVAHFAENILKDLKKLNNSLESLEPNDELTIDVPKKYQDDFGWQDKAYKLVSKVGKEAINKGFFGINLASTGKGKTRANARIMTALGEQSGRIRFSVAMGLRVLTLQTGREFQDELNLTEKELAIAVGGIAIKLLFEQQIQSAREERESEKQTAEESGSASQEELVDADIKIHYSGVENEHSLSRWTKTQKGLDALISAPVLVSTIDHLVPATEGTKGGKHIPSMLRLLTSDLVLDEPDDFGLSDLPALCRLVHWAGVSGSRVLLSSATLPPALVFALFQAYQAGWSEYAKANQENWSGEILCAWFDEKNICHDEQVKEFSDFQATHEKLINKRKNYLQTLPPKRIADIIDISENNGKSIIDNMADTIHAGALRLHQNHCLTNGEKTLSIGLVRMANINPLVAIAKALLAKVPSEDTCIHYCVYHSRYPLAIRAAIEQRLDSLLYRKDEQAIWQQPEIQQALQKHPEAKHHIFIVLASPVAEVGRNHDYDWAIVEPSSMRSIIQLAGRVLRHRNKTPEKSNVLLLNKNYKALCKKRICFERPGFESSGLIMEKHDLHDILDEEQFQKITAIHRIHLPKDYRKNNKHLENLALFEQRALAKQLFGDKDPKSGELLDGEKPANLWWKNQPHWCGEVQRQQRFRDSKKDEAYYLWLENEFSKPKWRWKNEHVSPPEFAEPPIEIKMDERDYHEKGNYFWFEQDALAIYQQLASDFGWALKEISNRFGEVRLIEYEKAEAAGYNFHPFLGVYQDIGSNE
ncbi:MAG: type I-F CRISPR-associated helicase Cas3 [Sedimentisphaerales bacterium]|nr:type I-F CRISPR-associated helicase Cas3 [Sedimentisphaerales bacterium]